MRLVKWFLARPVVLCAFMFTVQVVRRQWSERAFGNDSALDIPTEALQVFALTIYLLFAFWPRACFFDIAGEPVCVARRRSESRLRDGRACSAPCI